MDALYICIASMSYDFFSLDYKYFLLKIIIFKLDKIIVSNKYLLPSICCDFLRSQITCWVRSSLQVQPLGLKYAISLLLQAY